MEQISHMCQTQSAFLPERTSPGACAWVGGTRYHSQQVGEFQADVYMADFNSLLDAQPFVTYGNLFPCRRIADR